MVYQDLRWNRWLGTKWRTEWHTALRGVQQSLVPLMLPWRCVACGATGGQRVQIRQQWLALDLCTDCHTLLPFNQGACQTCALPLAQESSDDPAETLFCGQCLRRPPAQQRAFCALRYDYPATHLIRQLKYAQELAQARVLAVLLAHYLIERHPDTWPQCIVPVPLHVSRYRQRGYNQVIELGNHLATLLDIPLRTDLVTRIHATPEQAGLTRQQRRRNLRGAFIIRTSEMPTHVAVLDDVITTGSTLNELDKILLKAGVAELEHWGIARAAHHVKKS